MADATLHQQIADAEKQLEDLAAKTEALKKQARDADLAKAKELIKMHSFTASDLSPELKRARAATTTTKKASPKRSTKKK
jgi:hypothetical protein